MTTAPEPAPARGFWELGPLPATVEKPEEPAVDRLAEAPVTVRGRPLRDVLRPGYDAFRDA